MAVACAHRSEYFQTMVFRFIHTADLHLDSPLKTLALRDADLGSLIANATRQAFVRIIDACLEERVDALVVAGDLYDRQTRGTATLLFLAGQFKRLHDASIDVFLVRGNHDAAAVVTRHLTLPDNVTVFSTRGDCKIIGDKQVAIHGVSFKEGHIATSLIPAFKPPVEGAINIGILHTSLAGAEGHDVYAPCSVNDLTLQGFDYWALGHIHKRQVHRTAPTIVMPGIPQGRDINEAGAKSATLVTVNDNRDIHLSEIQTALAQFERIAVDVTGCEDLAAVSVRMRLALEAQRGAASADTLVARLKLTGTTPLAAKIRRDPELILAEAQQAAMHVGRTLIDTLEVGVAGFETKSAMGADPLSEIRGLLLNSQEGVDMLLPSAITAIKELQATLPADLRDQFGSDEGAIAALAKRLIDEGSEEVLARITDEGDA
jgi:DNA repair protein SbcD/Mre11